MSGDCKICKRDESRLTTDILAVRREADGARQMCWSFELKPTDICQTCMLALQEALCMYVDSGFGMRHVYA